MINHKITKFKIHSRHKACSFCKCANIPVVMEMRSGEAICSGCIDDIQHIMLEDKSNDVVVQIGVTYGD